MTPAAIPASCENCGCIFESRFLRFSGNVHNLILSGNKETCPKCGALADIADGVFDIADDVISVIYAPHMTTTLVAEINKIVTRAQAEKHSPQELAEQLSKVDPRLADLIRSFGVRWQWVAVTMILACIKCCNVDSNLEVRLDANQLIDQLLEKPPPETD